MYGQRFWELGEERLVKLLVEKLKESCQVEGRIQDVAKKVWLGGSQRGRVRVSSSLKRKIEKTELEKLARRGGQEK